LKDSNENGNQIFGCLIVKKKVLIYFLTDNNGFLAVPVKTTSGLKRDWINKIILFISENSVKMKNLAKYSVSKKTNFSENGKYNKKIAKYWKFWQKKSDKNFDKKSLTKILTKKVWQKFW